MKTFIVITILLFLSACATYQKAPALQPAQPTHLTNDILQDMVSLENSPSLVNDPAFMAQFEEHIRQAGLCDACQKGGVK